MINLTPHPITIQIDGREPVTFPPSGTVARVETRETPHGCLAFGDAFAEVPVVTREFHGLTGIPAEDIPCLVSSLVLSAVSGTGRKNTFAPDTGPTAIRDEAGHIVAVTRLVAA